MSTALAGVTVLDRDPGCRPGSRSAVASRRLDRVEARLSAVLNLAEQAVLALVPDGWQELDDPDCAVSGEKVLAETALLTLAAGRLSADHPNLSAQVDRLVQLTYPFAFDPAVRARMCTDPTMLLDHAFAAIALMRLGVGDPAMSTLLECCLPDIDAAARERSPHRALEQLWLAGLAGVRTAPGAVGRAVSGSAIGTGIDLLAARRDDFYALTHAIMYATDLGSAPLQLDAAAGTRLSRTLDAAIAISLDRHDYDLTAELAAGYPMLGLRATPVARFAIDVLFAVEDEAGLLPAPTLRLDRLSRLRAPHRSRYLHAASYHTMYVMGLLCTQLLRAEAPQLTCAPEPSQRPAAPARRRRGSPRHWEIQYELLSAAEQDGLASMVLTLALRDAVNECDLAAVADILRAAGPVVDQLPAAAQARLMLSRLSVASLT